MVEAGNTLLDLLDRLDRTIKADPEMTVKAMGLLLLGIKIGGKDVEEITDPTELLLTGPGLKTPKV